MEELKSFLEEGMKRLGFFLSQKQKDLFLLYLQELKTWNRKFNLTGIKDERQIILKHFLDSAAGIWLLKEEKNLGKGVDVGTGAGFPGIPLKILEPKMELTLLESSTKKTSFLENLIHTLGLDKIEIVKKRAEDYGKKEGREKFFFAFSRALGSLSLVAEYTLPLLQVGGCSIVYKGPQGEREIKRGARALEVLGGEIEKIFRFSLPFGGGRRMLLKLRKTYPTPSSFPRRIGIPAKRPL